MIFWGLLLLVVPFAMPFVNLALQWGLRTRLNQLEQDVERQKAVIDELKQRVRALRDEARAAARPEPDEAVAAPRMPTTPVVPSPEVAAPEVVAPIRPVPEPPRVAAPSRPARSTPVMPPASPPPAAAARPATGPRASFDWESVVGVKLFSGVAGIALVLAAVFFLRYSMDHGWLAPPVRVAIGILVASALLVVCELKAARDYPATANALDAAAIAILFATFFAAYALWHLLPATLTFGLLALVTAVAVLLSIRRNSLFIAVLGLLGGFATPALLSTGENRPIPLFAYVLLLNIGLARVASRRKWPVLTVMTLALTALYQWGWVDRFLSANQLSLSMGVFLTFALVSFGAVTFGRTGDAASDATLGQLGLGFSAMPFVFAIYLATVPAYGAHAGLLFGFLLLLDAGLAAVTIGHGRSPDGPDEPDEPLIRGDHLHALGAIATVLVFAIWLAQSYTTTAWVLGAAFVLAFVVLYSLTPFVAARMGRPLAGVARRAEYAAPILLFVFPILGRIEPQAASPTILFGALSAALGLIAWRALTTGEPGLYFIGAFFTIAAEASWSATFLTAERLGTAIAWYAAFGLVQLGVPLIGRQRGQPLTPRWGAGALTIGSLGLLLFLTSRELAPQALWGLAFLLAILNAALFIESASGGLPWLSAIGALLSWLVLGVWWNRAAAAVGLLPSLAVLVGLTLVMFTGHAWAYRQSRPSGGHADRAVEAGGFQHGIYLGLIGHLFLFYVAQDARWSAPPWPLFASLAAMTLAASAASIAIGAGELHAAAVIAAAFVVLAWSVTLASAWATTALIATETVVAYALAWSRLGRRRLTSALPAAVGTAGALYVAETLLIAISASRRSPPVGVMTLLHVLNVSLILWVAWQQRWVAVAPAAVVPAGLAFLVWQARHPEPAAWKELMALAAPLYAVFTAYPFVLHRRAKDSRDPYLTAVAGSAFFLLAATSALSQGGLAALVGAVPVVEAAILALLLRELLKMQAPGARDLGRLAFVAGAALAFVTVAIPLQLKHQWITIGWALEGAALTWLYRRIPHRKLLYTATALLALVFARLALNPSVFVYEPRGGMRVFNWYLYTYATCAAAMLAAGWLASKTDDRVIEGMPPARSFLPGAAVVLLFIVLNIEIADFYANGPEILFKFGVTIAQDLTYTIGWLIFGLGLLTAGIYLHNRPGRIAAVVLITVTTCKAFLYDMGSLGGLYRVASLVGLAISLSLVALALQRFVLAPKEAV